MRVEASPPAPREARPLGIAPIYTQGEPLETREPSDKYASIGAELMASEPALAKITEHGVKVAFLASDSEKRGKGRTVFGECERIPAKWKWAVPYDFAITVFEPNVERFSDEQMRVLLLHELMHVGVDVDGNEARFFTVPHDFEEFREIAERFGLEWSS